MPLRRLEKLERLLNLLRVSINSHKNTFTQVMVNSDEFIGGPGQNNGERRLWEWVLNTRRSNIVLGSRLKLLKCMTNILVWF